MTRVLYGPDGRPVLAVPCVVGADTCSSLAPTCQRCGRVGPPCEPTYSEHVDLRTGRVTRVIGYCGID